MPSLCVAIVQVLTLGSTVGLCWGDLDDSVRSGRIVSPESPTHTSHYEAGWAYQVSSAKDQALFEWMGMDEVFVPGRFGDGGLDSVPSEEASMGDHWDLEKYGERSALTLTLASEVLLPGDLTREQLSFASPGVEAGVSMHAQLELPVFDLAAEWGYAASHQEDEWGASVAISIGLRKGWEIFGEVNATADRRFEDASSYAHAGVSFDLNERWTLSSALGARVESSFEPEPGRFYSLWVQCSF